MHLVKIWIGILSLLVAVAMGITFAMPQPVSREIARTHAKSLERLQLNAELTLRLESRDWIDVSGRISRDNTLIDLFEQAEKKRSEANQLADQISARLFTLIKPLKVEEQPKLLIAVDASGKLLSLVGDEENKYQLGKDGLAGHPLVNAALHGFRADSYINLGGHLFLAAAAPVITNNKPRYLGAIVIGREIDQRTADHYKTMLGEIDTGFFLRGKMIGGTFKSTELAKLPLQYSKMREQIMASGKSDVLLVEEGDKTYQVVLIALPGPAAAHDAFLALISTLPSNATLSSILATMSFSDWKWPSFPWLQVLGLLIILLAAGLGLFIMRIDLPTRKFIDDLYHLSRGEITRLDDANYPRFFQDLVLGVNNLREKLKQSSQQMRTHEISELLNSSSESSVGKLKTIEKQSTLPAPAAPKANAQATLPSLDDLSDSAFSKNIDLPESDGSSQSEIQKNLIRNDLLPEIFAHNSKEDSFTKEITKVNKEVEKKAAELKKPDKKWEKGESTSDNLSTYDPSISTQDKIASTSDLEDTAVAKPLKSFERIDAGRDRSQSGISIFDDLTPISEKSQAQLRLKSSSQPTREAPSVPTLENPRNVTLGDEDLDGYFRRVYQEFLALKNQCGERTDNLNFPAFAAKLRKNRESLLQRYHSRSVEFSVYIKDGKAALKATPIK